MSKNRIYDNIKKSEAYGAEGTPFDFIEQLKEKFPDAKEIVLDSLLIFSGNVCDGIKAKYIVDGTPYETTIPGEWGNPSSVVELKGSSVFQIKIDYGTVAAWGNSVGNVEFLLTNDITAGPYGLSGEYQKILIFGGNPIIGLYGAYNESPISPETSRKLCKLGVYFDETPFERINKITPNDILTKEKRLSNIELILNKGFHSSQQIVEAGLANFIGIFPNFPVTPEESDFQLTTFNNALNVNQWLNNLRASYVLPEVDSAVAPPAPHDSAQDAFNEEISYVNLFPGTQFCSCNKCLSNQSPAAFFTSLMEITGKYVKTTTEQKVSLEDRRSDLWTLPLTCDKSNVEQPYLQIVNNNLLEYLDKAEPKVNWENLASDTIRFIPYNQPNQHIRSVLASAKVSLQEVAARYSKGERDSAAWVYETLGLCKTDVNVLTKASTGLDPNITPKSFREATGLNIESLELLVYDKLSSDEIAKGFLTKLFINARSGDMPLRYYKKTKAEHEERFENLTQEVLVQIRSFLILATNTGWTYSDMNYVLEALNIKDFISDEHDPEKNEKQLKNIAYVKFISEKLLITPVMVISMITDIPTTGVNDDALPQAPFDQLFNAHLLLQAEGTILSNDLPPYHPKEGSDVNYEKNILYQSMPIKYLVNLLGMTWESIRFEVTEEDKQQLQQVLSGIPCTPLEVMLIVRWLNLPLEEGVRLKLTVENLSAIYAHALLAQKSGLPVASYIDLIRFLEIKIDVDTNYRITLDELFDLVCKKELLAEVSFSVSNYISVLRIAKTIKEKVNDPAKDIISFVTQLKQKLNQTKSSVDTSKTGSAIELQVLLFRQWVHETAVFFAFKENHLISAVSGLCDNVNGHINPEKLNAFIMDGTTEEKIKQAAIFFQNIVPHLFFIQKAELEDSEINFVYRYIIKVESDSFLWPDIASGSLIFDIINLKCLLKSFKHDKKIDFLKLLSGENYFNEKFLEGLEGITGWHMTAVKELKDTFYADPLTKVNVCVHLLLQIRDCFSTADTIRLDTLRLLTLASLITENDWNKFSIEATQLESIIRSKYTSDEWQQMFRKDWGNQLEKDRDVLLPVVIDKLKTDFPDITNPDHVSDYFLMDVSMGGNMDISPVREAMDAIQTYLQRCRTGLEKIDIKKFNEIPPKWWEWIPSYRIWQANQKILQYPENYIQAGVRSNETDSFKKFKSSLQQQNLTSETVDTAFKKYLDDWCDLSNLTIVDMCQYKVYDPNRGEDVDTLFVFGRNDQEPATYYYNTEDEYGNWGQWKKIDVNINSDMINSVYVFNRLFIFWTEQSTITDNDPTLPNGKYTMYSLTIKYSYQDFNGNWSNVQTLKEFPFYLETAESSELIENKDAFKSFSYYSLVPSKRYWKKISLTPIEINRNDVSTEQVLQIFLGPLESSPLTNKFVKPIKKCDSPGPYDRFFNFFDEISKKIIPTSGYAAIACIPPIFLNTDLTTSYLFSSEEKYIFKANNNEYKAYASSSDGAQIRIVPSHNFIGNNYDGGLFTSNAYSIPILNILDKQTYKAPDLSFTVRNLPMSFWINLRESTFLFRNIPDRNFDPVIQLNKNNYKDGIVSICNNSVKKQEETPIEFRTTRIVFGAAGKIEKDVLDRGIEGILKNKKIQQSDCECTEPKGIFFQPKSIDFNIEITPTDDGIVYGYVDIPGANEDILWEGYTNNIPIAAASSINETYQQNNFAKGNSAMTMPIKRNIMSSFQISSQSSFGVAQIIYSSLNLFKDWQEVIEKEGVFNEDGLFVVFNSNNDNNINGNVTLKVNKNGKEEVRAGCSTYIQKTSFCVPILNGEQWKVETPGDLTPSYKCYWLPFEISLEPSVKIENAKTYYADSDGFVNVCLKLTDLTKANSASINLGSSFEQLTKILSINWDGNYSIPITNELFFTLTLPVSAGMYYSTLFGNSTYIEVLDLQWFPAIAGKKNISSDCFYNVIQIIPPSDKNKPPYVIPPSILCNDQIDFNGPYGIYAWELFFHAPALVASTFNKNLQFRKAQKWWQYIFNPTGISFANKQDAWQFLPFREFESGNDSLWADIGKLTLLNAEPFNPDFIAQIRHDSYMKWVVMQYLDNLIAWGDMEFGADTWESLSAATLFYFEAEDLLGKKPNEDSCVDALIKDNRSFDKITEEINHRQLTNFEIDQENLLPDLQNLPCTPIPGILPSVYFCSLPNEQLEAYWSKVKDRLFKLRNGLNLQGQLAMPSLYGQAINPTLLASMEAAGGVNPESASLLQAQIPYYRFKSIIGNAISMTDMVSQFGSQLLSALQQQDAETIQVMQSTQQVVLLNMISQSMQQAIDDAQAELDALSVNLESNTYSQTYYRQLLSAGLNAGEITNIASYTASTILNEASAAIKVGSAVAYLIPTIYGFSDGGFQPGAAVESAGHALDSVSQLLQTEAMLSSAMAEYERRSQEWNNQLQLTTYSIEQIKKQIEASTIRLQITQSNYQQHFLSVQQATDVQNFLTQKFTNKELYEWMSGRIASLYFDAYQLALSMAYMAQRAYQYELCDISANFIPSNSWDSIHKGLLAGETLKLSLIQMQKSYYQNNERGLEVEKIIPLKAKNSEKWKTFIDGGTLTFDIIDSDLKTPSEASNYLIKTVSISIPAVIGPYQTFNAVLCQTKNQTKAGQQGDYGINNQKVIISRGIDDSGLFLLNFEDDRYLPFEGTGAISSWKFQLDDPEIRKGISDIIFNIKYVIK